MLAATRAAGHDAAASTELPARLAPIETTIVEYRWNVLTPHLTLVPYDIAARVYAPTMVPHRIDYDVLEWTSEHRRLGRVAEFHCKYSDFGLPNQCVTTWRDVYVDVPVPVMRRDYIELDVPRWSEHDWHAVADVPQITWTRETLVVSLPALAVPRSSGP